MALCPSNLVLDQCFLPEQWTRKLHHLSFLQNPLSVNFLWIRFIQIIHIRCWCVQHFILIETGFLFCCTISQFYLSISPQNCDELPPPSLLLFIPSTDQSSDQRKLSSSLQFSLCNFQVSLFAFHLKRQMKLSHKKNPHCSLQNKNNRESKIYQDL